MTDSQLEKLRQKGVDPDILAKNLNLMYLCADMSEAFCNEVERTLKPIGLYRNIDKQNLNKLKHHAKLVTDSINKTMRTESVQVSFGELSDFLQDVLCLSAYFDTEDLRTRAKALLTNLKNTTHE